MVTRLYFLLVESFVADPFATWGINEWPRGDDCLEFLKTSLRCSSIALSCSDIGFVLYKDYQEISHQLILSSSDTRHIVARKEIDTFTQCH